MRRLLFSIFLLLSGLLHPQEGESLLPASPFPLGPVLVEALCGDGRWRPDWPLEIAPDAFTVKGRAAAVTMEITGVWEAGGGAGDAEPGMEAGAGPVLRGPRYRGIAYRLARDSQGRLAAFPLALGLEEREPDPPALVFAQVEVRRGEGIEELRILAPAPPAEEARAEDLAGETAPAGTPAAREDPAGGSAKSPADMIIWSVLFSDPFLPGMPPGKGPVKVQTGEDTYYVLFAGGMGRIAETWYDPLGNFVAYFETRIGETRIGPGDAGPRVLGLRGQNFNRDYRYESGGNLSECSGDQGFFSALYGGRARPLYWTAGRDYGLSWDEGDRLIAMRDLGPASGASGDFPAAFRYEYDFDSRGNWIRRREIALFRRENLLIPGRMWETVRQIDYPQGD
jgi:hypothetical protein